MVSLGSGLSKYVTAPVTGLGVATLKTATDFVKLKESSMGVFKQMLGGADAAENMYQELLNIAKASTYSQEAFLTAGKTLVGMGTDANNTAKYLQAITDAVAGFGGTSADIESLASVFGKVQAKGKLLTDDLNMLAERGVNGLQILASHYKVTTDEMQEMVSKGMVPAEKGLDILCDGMENGYTYAGKFHQGMAGMAQSLKGGTLTGALDSLKSSFRNMAVEMWGAFENKPQMIEAVNSIGNAMGKLPAIMEPITKAIGPMLQGFADKLNMVADYAEKHPKKFQMLVSTILNLAVVAPVIAGLGKTISGLGKTIDTVTKVHTVFGKSFSIGSLIVKSFTGIVKGLFTVLKGGITVVKLLGTGIKALGAIMMANPITLIIAAIVAVIVVLVLLYKKCEPFRNFVNNLVSSIVGFLQNLWKNIVSIATSIFTFVSGVTQAIWNVISTVINTIVNILAIPYDYLKNAIILIVALVAMGLELVWNILSTVATWIWDNVLSPIVNFVVGIFETIVGYISSFISTVWGILSTIANWIWGNVLTPIITFFINAFNKIKQTVITVVNAVKSVFQTVFNAIWGVISGVINKIKSAFQTVAGVVRTVFNNVKNFISNIFSTIAGIIKAPINGVISAINTVLKAMNKVKVPDWVPGLGGKGVNFKMIPKLSTGTNYVQHEGLAYLHQGEAVVPKQYNPAVGGYGNMQPVINVYAEMDVNKFGQAFVHDIKTFSGGTKNSYNYGGGF